VTTPGPLCLDLVGRGAAGVGRAQAAAVDWLRAQGFPPASVARAELLIEEVALNILRHGFAAMEEPAASLRVSLQGDRCILEFEDRGRPFDPTQAPLPAPAASLAEARIGGLGVPLIRAMAVSARYARSTDGRNLLRLEVAAGERLTG
jgi:serine/threonine-protein kinase RsbW